MQAAFRPRPEGLEIPHVWRAPELACAQEVVVASGHAALDAQLSGGGWPQGCLIELLQQRPHQHVWSLLAPALASLAAARTGPTVLVAPPLVPYGPALQAMGISSERLLCVHAEQAAPRLWAAEQSLRCADAVAVLAWLPQARTEELRRLHLCAQQHDKLLFVLRPSTVRDQATPARVRLLVEGSDHLQVRILKRRGPPLLQPMQLSAGTPAITALLSLRKGRWQTSVSTPREALTERSHALDRTASVPA